MDKEDRTSLLAAMYQDDNDLSSDETATAEYHHSPVTQAGRTRRIRVGAIEYEVPSIEHMQHLERLISQQNETLLQQRRLIDRLAAVLGRTQSAQRLHLLKTDELRRELSTKLTVRSDTSQ